MLEHLCLLVWVAIHRVQCSFFITFLWFYLDGIRLLDDWCGRFDWQIVSDTLFIGLGE